MKLAILSAAAFSVCLAASAQSSNLVTSVTEDDLTRIAEDAGHEVIGYGEAGDVFVRAQTEDGTVYYMTGTACSPEGACQGINMSARFEANDLVTFEKINDINIRRAAVSVWLMDGTTLGISRYVILDDGMTEANIHTNLDNFIAIVPGVIDMFYEDSE